ncbi:peptidylprolyl isomerase [Castellaniella sp. FW104-16D08]|uniref:peptidylprolyl isomerase n=1 Tax=unclassified Castellaniella TaxID=2617606 RepID=UPI003314AA24
MMRHPAGMFFLALVLGCSLALPVASAAQTGAAKTAKSGHAQPPAQQFVDGIAAIVNKQVITLSQLADKQVQVRQQMKAQNIPVPQEDVFKRQVLQQMINAALQDQEAARVGVQVSDAQVQRALQSIAQRNGITVDQLKSEIVRSGMDWDQYQSEIRTQIQDDRLRQRFVEDRISVSDSDIDAFLQTHQDLAVPVPLTAGQQQQIQQQHEAQIRQQQEQQAAAAQRAAMANAGPELFEVAQILIEVPDYASNEVVAQKRKEAEAILRKLKSGADFAGLAAASSNGPQALEGGKMGIRPLKDWPDLFARTIKDIPPGGVSGVVQSGRGFHILKVLRRGYAQRPVPKKAPAQQPAPVPAPQPPVHTGAGPMMVTQTHARHILIKTDKVTSDEKARAILEGLRTRIEHGESFAELAKRYSQDASAPKGGDLGWLNPGETVPAFELAMGHLQKGEVSEPVKTPFGWHLIQVEDRRSKNMETEFRRIQARRELVQRRIGPAYEDWLDQLRSQAYIDNRLDHTQSGTR